MDGIKKILSGYKDSIKQLLFVDKQDWIGPKVWVYLVDNPTFLITTLYLYISGLGLLFEYVLFGEFGINVLDYSEASDFFLAAFKRPEAFLISIIIASTFLFYRVGANFARKQQRSLFLRIILLSVCLFGLFRREILIPLGVIYFVILYVLSAGVEAQWLVHSSNTIVKISSKFGKPKEVRVIPIGTTERFIFGIQVSDEFIRNRETYRLEDIIPPITAIPFTNILRIKYQNSNEGLWQSFYNKFILLLKKIFFLEEIKK